MPPEADKRPHLVLHNTSEAVAFTAHSPGGGSSPPLPVRDRQTHGQALQGQLQALKPLMAQATQAQRESGMESGLGLQVEFEGQPDVELAFQSLGNETKRIELLSVRKAGDVTYANVFVPDGKLAHFETYVAEYLADRKGASGQSLDHKPLLNTIASIRRAELRALWTDDPALLPDDADTAFWWEVWLPVREDRLKVVENFRRLARSAGCEVSEHQANFPERTVITMFGSEAQLSQSVLLLNCVAELRKAKDTAEFFDGMGIEEQGAWMDDMLAHAVWPDAGAPHVCLIDSGVNRGHPMLAPLLDGPDQHTVNPAWGVDDTANHGTGLAGLATYGELTAAVGQAAPVTVTHRLESVKLVSEEGDNAGDARHHAYLFAEAVSRPEITHPDRARVFATAVTASDYRDRGRPSSWSAMLDRLASDVDGGGETPRLFVLASGNTRSHDAWMTYPDSLATNLVHDPGQAWNALTVGACTHKIDTEIAGLAAIAAEGSLSPYTTTSRTWDSAWPLKPDVVFEGGNVGKDKLGASGIPALNLLTTHNVPDERLFTTTNATSAASALCARMAAQVMAAYPQFRAETVRALIVHAAEWTPAMRQMFLPVAGQPSKQDYVNLIRHCGWGTPDLELALWSAGNSLSLVIEDAVHPYTKEKGRGVISRDMNLHALPWPQEELEALQNARVQMRATLSYFVEPNPSARGAASKFHYPSHRLRFDLKRPLEAVEDFVARINAAAQQVDDGAAANPRDAGWHLGDRQRHRGSLHQDVWEGTAAELASRGFLAVYPSAGWWRTRPGLERYALPARYSLIVSLRTEQTDIDLYSVIANKIAIEV